MNDTTKGILISPLVPCVLWALLMFNPFVLLFALPISFFVAVFVGLPLFLLFKKIWFVNLFTCCIGGVLAATIFGATLLLWDNTGFSVGSDFFSGLFLFQLFGLSSGLAFWFISVRKNANQRKT